jgi:uncharacterized protein with ATP-grasp and redox domains
VYNKEKAVMIREDYTDYKCIKCILERYLNIEKIDLDDKTKTLYTKEVLKLIARVPVGMRSPEIVEKITRLQKKYNVRIIDYTQIKKHYNNLLLGMEDKIQKSIKNSDDGLYTAACYALTGNYIDFGPTQNITEEKLQGFIDNIGSVSLNKTEFENFRNELKTAKKLVYLTDNCGEIVFDKLFISYIKENYKDISINVIVRGKDVLNDATMADAKQVALTELVDVCDNGIGVGGTVLRRINKKSRKLIDKADLIISKGMGNFETLEGCNKNIYYMFLCKCEKFCRMFDAPLYTYMFLNERRKNI